MTTRSTPTLSLEQATGNGENENTPLCPICKIFLLLHIIIYCTVSIIIIISTTHHHHIHNHGRHHHRQLIIIIIFSSSLVLFLFFIWNRSKKIVCILLISKAVSWSFSSSHYHLWLSTLPSPRYCHQHHRRCRGCCYSVCLIMTYISAVTFIIDQLFLINSSIIIIRCRTTFSNKRCSKSIKWNFEIRHN